MSRINRFPTHIDPKQLQRGRENHDVLREQYEYDQQHAQQRRMEMAGRQKSPTGIVRAALPVDDAKTAVGELNRKLDEALDEVERAMQRGQLAGRGAATDDDLHRSAALRKRKGGA